MTLNDLLGAVRRRWFVLLGVLFVALFVSLLTWRAPGVYWATTKVYFLVPANKWQPNQIAPDNSLTIPLAGLIQTEINGGIPARTAVSPNVSLVDEGIYDGWSVLLPDTGGQWANNFPDACLVVQASGPTAEVVQARTTRLVNEIERLVAEREDAAGVHAASRVEFTVSPPSIAMQYSSGHRHESVGVIMLLGAWVGAAACWFVDRVVRASRRGGEQDDRDRDAGLWNATGGHQDGPRREGVGASPGIATSRGGDRATP